jgi:hypothetical protein
MPPSGTWRVSFLQDTYGAKSQETAGILHNHGCENLMLRNTASSRKLSDRDPSLAVPVSGKTFGSAVNTTTYSRQQTFVPPL